MPPLKDQLKQLLDDAYPEPWKTEWLSLPGSESRPGFNVACSEIASNLHRPDWPPVSRDPRWMRWRPKAHRGFYIRPRQDDPLIRDRFILVQPSDLHSTTASTSITISALEDAMLFANTTGRIVWHNPPKGGARFPQSAHFQSMPLLKDDGTDYSMPFCKISDPEWSLDQELHAQLVFHSEYPIHGLIVCGPLSDVAATVWHVIDGYDAGLACNLIVQPPAPPNLRTCRVFISPRAREPANYLVTKHVLRRSEELLLRNCPGGRTSDWPFAGVEMGLVTQVVWAPLFETMKRNPRLWGLTLERLAMDLTLKLTDRDWAHFLNVSMPWL